MLKDDIIDELLRVLPDECSVSYVYVKFIDENGEEMVAEIIQKTH